MCNWMEKAKAVNRTLKGKPVDLSFPQGFIRALPPTTAIPYHCLICKRPLNQAEMFPLGRTPRYMCQVCYDEAAYGAHMDRCLLWGKPLPMKLLKERQKNPRELEYALCPNECQDYWSVLAGRVLGCNFNFTNTQPLLPQSNFVTLPCSSGPEPAFALPYFGANESNQTGLYAAYKFKLLQIKF